MELSVKEIELWLLTKSNSVWWARRKLRKALTMGYSELNRRQIGLVVIVTENRVNMKLGWGENLSNFTTPLRKVPQFPTPHLSPSKEHILTNSHLFSLLHRTSFSWSFYGLCKHNWDTLYHYYTTTCRTKYALCVTRFSLDTARSITTDASSTWTNDPFNFEILNLQNF